VVQARPLLRHPVTADPAAAALPNAIVLQEVIGAVATTSLSGSCWLRARYVEDCCGREEVGRR
jgi:hypothetical protein